MTLSGRFTLSDNSRVSDDPKKEDEYQDQINAGIDFKGSYFERMGRCSHSVIKAWTLSNKHF